MKNLLKYVVVIIISLYGHLFAQDDSVAVIAVGEAQVAKEKILYVGIEGMESLGPELKQWAGEIEELMKGDFAFYRHKFEFTHHSVSATKPVSSPSWESWGKEQAEFVLALKVVSKGSKLDVSAYLFQSSVQKIKAQYTVDINQQNLRTQGHRLADAIYQSITGKKSIFNNKIYFISDRTSSKKEPKKELYVMDFDGRRVERLTFFDSTVISPAVSPDNSKLMFSLIRPSGTSGISRNIKNIDLMTYDLKTKKYTPVSQKPGINSGAIYSADGKKIYYTLSISGSADIYELELASQKLRRLTTHYGEDVDPSITADGKLMTFLSNRAGKAHIFTMDPSVPEKDIKRISYVGQFNATPRFSPDGKEIVFVSWVDAGFDLYRIDSQGQNLVRLTKNSGSNEEPSYSPDAEFILFTSQKVISRTEATQDIYLMNREGEILAQLTQGFGQCFSPRWSN